MPNQESKVFTIGQFAALHRINKKTLMWYDEIGLLKPAFKKENGYRYYTFQQSARLDAILMLRELKVSLPEIQSFLQNRSAATLETLLQEKIAELDHTIQHLNTVRSTLLQRQRDMQFLQQLDLTQITLVQKEPQYLITIPTAATTPIDDDITHIIAAMNQNDRYHLYDASYGIMQPAESLYAGQYDDYRYLFIQLPAVQPQPDLHLQPGGLYLRAYCQGNWDNLPIRYQQIMAYAQQQKLALSGYSYETGINDLVVDTDEDYITCIEIPVAPL